MSTKISNVYDDILTELAAVFPSKTRIPDAYNLQNNPTIFLRDSYGLRVDAATPTNRDFCTFSRFRNFSIVLTREVLDTEIETTRTDTAIKGILDDMYTLQKNFLAGDQFGSSANIDIVNVGAFSGIDVVFSEKGHFVVSEVAFSIMVSDTY